MDLLNQRWIWMACLGFFLLGYGCNDSEGIFSSGADAGSEISSDLGDIVGGEFPCGGYCPPAFPYCDPAKDKCRGCLEDWQCDGEKVCSNWVCKDKICSPGLSYCADNKLVTCNADGTGEQIVTCEGPCVNDHCEECADGSKGCDGLSQLSCVEGSWEEAGKCEINQVCYQGTCMPCTPDANYCDKGDIYHCTLSEDGATFFGEFLEDCDTANTGKICDEGTCRDHCEVNVKFNTSIGCEYWAVDLDNAVEEGPDGETLDADSAPFAVIVSNPSDKFVATVRILRQEEDIDVVKIPPLQLRAINLPNQDLDGTVRGQFGYKIQSNSPISAYQFNPLDNVNVFSNDASMLLPSNALGSEYRVLSRAQSQEAQRGFFTVIAVTEGETNVEIVSTANTLAGEGVASLVPGGKTEYTLEFGEILNIETDGFGEDLTGSHITADQRIAVFGGSEAANVPTTEVCLDGKCSEQGWDCDTNADCPVTCCADHLEQQLPPVSTWGTKYLAAHAVRRGDAKDTWRILATEPDTKVSTIPYQANIPLLGPGEWVEFESADDFLIEGDKPILVAQFLASQNSPNPNSDLCVYYEQSLFGPGKFCDWFFGQGSYIKCESNVGCPNIQESGDASIGDPAFIMSVPYSQYRETYVFLVPDEYSDNFINVMAPAQATVDLSGTQLGEDFFTEMGNGYFKVARIQVEPGVHRITADTKFGVTVYGWSQYVSYGYPAGQNLSVLSL